MNGSNPPRRMIVSRPESKRPWYLWVNILSLDAPAVALAWQDLFARSLHVPLNPAPRFITAACVWLAYAGDRLLDGNLSRAEDLVTPRHQFARAHRGVLALVWSSILLVTAACAFGMLRSDLVRSGLVLSALVLAYFIRVHWPGRKPALPGFKEAGVAALFSTGSITFVVARLGHFSPSISAPVFYWLLLCFLNCFGIGCWEKDRDARQRQVSLVLQAPGSGRCFRPLALALAAAAMAAGLAGLQGGFYAVYFSVSASAFMLAGLDYFSPVLDLDGLRVAADFVLLTPLLFLPFGVA